MPFRVIWPPAGRYILAVSGGADSMTLLHLLAGTASAKGYDLVVAHFDHGLRPDSAADHDFVQGAAARYGLPFVGHAAHLARAAVTGSPAQVSEAIARAARHAWLAEACRSRHAAAVITAHHQDDLIETSLLNLARGAGRRGLAPMQSGPILRPLLHVARADLRHYATTHHLTWREDPTNADLTNPRNFLRHRLLARATPSWRRRYLALIDQLASINQAIDVTLGAQLRRLLDALPDTYAKIETQSQKFPMPSKQSRPTAGPTNPAPRTITFPRAFVQDLSLAELAELIAAATRTLAPGIELDRRLLQELALFAKTARPHRRRPLRDGLTLSAHPSHLKLAITLKHHKIR